MERDESESEDEKKGGYRRNKGKKRDKSLGGGRGMVTLMKFM